MELKLEELTEEQKIGMLLCARSFRDEDDLSFVLELIRNHALGSVQPPIGKPEIVQQIRQAADYPILIITDMEMGFPTSELSPVPLMTLSACDKPEYFRSFARAVVRDAKAAGFNGTWGPVIDVKEPGFRRISDDPEKWPGGRSASPRSTPTSIFSPAASTIPAASTRGTPTWWPTRWPPPRWRIC